MKILAIGAHLDDIEISCGGTLIRASQKNQLKLLVATNSAYKDYNGKILRTVKEAKMEGKMAARKLKVEDLEILNFKTKTLTYNDKLVEAIEKPLVEFDPDIILTHWVYDTHQDHRSVGLATISAARLYNNILMYEPFPPSGRSYEAFRPQFYVDISETIGQKILAIKQHNSQLTKYGADWVDAIIGRARLRGFESGSKFAEVFEVLRLKLENDRIF